MSIDYYNKKAKEFIENTYNANMSAQYAIFEKHLFQGASILDLGSGAGRDSAYFLSKKYDVVAIDASEELVNYSKQFLGNNVLLETFNSYQPNKKFHGIWACASLLHLDDTELKVVINKYLNFLTKNGVFYMSFKKRKENYYKDDRFFNCFDQDRITKFITHFKDIEIIELLETDDVRPNRIDEKWINIVLRKF